MTLDLALNDRAPIAAWAPPLVGRAFAPHGRGPDAFDCWGLLAHVFALTGRRVPSYVDAYAAVDFAARADLDALIRAEVQAWRPLAAAGPGDPLLCTLFGRAVHVGVCAGAGLVLHARAKAGVVLEAVTRDGGLRLGDYKVTGAYALA